MGGKATGFAAVTTLLGTAFAAVAPNDVVVWSGVAASSILAGIAAYQKFRDTKRAADLADSQALSDTWKARAERATAEAKTWQERSTEWQKLYRAARRDPDGSTETGSGEQSQLY